MKFVTKHVPAVFGFVLLVGVAGCTSEDLGLPTIPTDLNPTPASSSTPPETPKVSPSPSTSPSPKPSPSVTPSPKPSPTTEFASCVVERLREQYEDDSYNQCIGLKIVSYKDSNGVPSLSRTAAIELMKEVNDVWKPCDIAFQIEEYVAVDPRTLGMAYGSESQSQLTSIRREFSEKSTFLLTVTGPWSGGTIAWTTMPSGSGPYGAIVESDYGDNPFTVGHELGHYMGLYHIRSSSNLMNPYIGSNTKALTMSQCTTARNTNASDWRVMLRK